MDTLFGKVAIVTGGSAGIGRATAIALAERGVKVVISDVDVDRGQQLAAELRDKGYEATFARADVSVDAEVASLVQRAVDEFGGLDLAFNNFAVQELPRLPGTYLADVFPTQVEWADGYLLPPTRPGLGVELDDEAAAAAGGEYKDGHSPQLRRLDGAFTNW